MYRAQTGQRAVVEPIPPILARRLEQPSSSKQPAGQTAYASKDLFTALVATRRRQRKGISNGDEVHTEERIGIAVSWPKERRLVDKGKGREDILVIWVIPVFDDVSLATCYKKRYQAENIVYTCWESTLCTASSFTSICYPTSIGSSTSTLPYIPHFSNSSAHTRRCHSYLFTCSRRGIISDDGSAHW